MTRPSPKSEKEKQEGQGTSPDVAKSDLLLPARSRRVRRNALDNEAKSAICAWFGWDENRLECSPGLPERELRLRECMNGLLEGMGVKERLQGKELCERWAEVVGSPIAAHAQPTRLRDGVLTIACDHPAWLEELSRFHQQPILRNISAVFGAGLVKKLRFRIG